MEALQSRYSIEELIEELHEQIQENSAKQVTLIGHSWGAWLVLLLAERYPELVKKIVLVGCPPLKDCYVSEIGKRRFENLSADQGSILQRVIEQKATKEDMQLIPGILEKSDNYCLDKTREFSSEQADSEMYNRVWSEAAKLRTEGKLLETVKRVKCTIYLLQGAIDPHPVNGVVEPLKEAQIPCETYVLERCGHSPFLEKYAKEGFYRILTEKILLGCK